jgi:hypothetical protein
MTSSASTTGWSAGGPRDITATDADNEKVAAAAAARVVRRLIVVLLLTAAVLDLTRCGRVERVGYVAGGDGRRKGHPDVVSALAVLRNHLGLGRARFG